ncbi:putative MFS transporter [Aspergillus undulatus]|uniref:putative MFS transporter n=1 Tax=Aspergillus undulatus TaxID=1810928 RepID=UPI003CCCE9AF
MSRHQQHQHQHHAEQQRYHDDRNSDSEEDAPFLTRHSQDVETRSSKLPGAKLPPGENGKETSGVIINGAIRQRLMITLLIMTLAVEVGFVMAGGPMTRIYESIACREHFSQFDPSKLGSDGQVPEELCKGKEVQSEVAAVKGYMEFFEGMLSIILAAPYGLLADRYGRKKALCFGIPGFVLNCSINFGVMWFSDVFPLRAVWASCVTFVFGGGPVVTMAIIYTMMADVTTEEERAAMFFRFGVASMGADFVSSAASSWLMTLNPWIPLAAGWSLTIVGVFMALLLPETKNAITPRSYEHPSEMELDPLSSADEPKMSISSEKFTADPVDGNEDLGTPFMRERRQQSRLSLKAIGSLFRSYLRPYAFILRTKSVLLLLTAFLVYRLSRGSSWFLVQYISARYNWTISQANLLTSFKPALTIPLFLFIIPFISKHLLRDMKSNMKDLTLARASIMFLAIGTLGIGLSPSVAMLIPSLLIQTSGSGFAYLARSLITTLVEREETARLFTVIEVLQAIGNVIASLSITNVFQLGLELGGPWVGLAWMMTSTAFCLVGVAIWKFEVPLTAEDKIEEHGD